MGLKAVHFGGGNIGRGFVAEKLALSGFEVVFLDVVDSLIEQLQSKSSYNVTEISSEGTKTNTITGYRAINSRQHEDQAIKEIETADLVTCAVGPNILKFIAPVIAKGINGRTASQPLAVVACENAIGATDTLAGFIKDAKNTPEDRLASIHERARFGNSAIDRIVPGQDPDAGLDVKIESYFEWVVESTQWTKDGLKHPEIEGVKWVEDLTPYIERKLYTVNTSHAAAAYYGYNRGIKTIDEAMANKEVNDIVRSAVKETANLIVRKHGISVAEQNDYVEKIITRISNPHLKDVVERVGRAPIRKLGRKERFLGPATELAEQDQSTDALLGCVEMAFRFQNVEGDDESKELAETLKANDAATVVKKITGLTEADKIYPKVVAIVEKVKGSS